MASMLRTIERKKKVRKVAVAYARYSSSNQREESIDAQLRAIREYCERENIQLIAEFTDEAVSGKTDDREDFQNMINKDNCKIHFSSDEREEFEMLLKRTIKQI